MENKTGIELIAEERREQIEKHGRTVEQDVSYNAHGQLIQAVRQLIRPENERDPMEKVLNSEGFAIPKGWDGAIFAKMMRKDRIDRLTIAAALIAAEIDRLQSQPSTP